MIWFQRNLIAQYSSDFFIPEILQLYFEYQSYDKKNQMENRSVII